jgi:hypothetical protein
MLLATLGPLSPAPPLPQAPTAPYSVPAPPILAALLGPPGHAASVLRTARRAVMPRMQLLPMPGDGGADDADGAYDDGLDDAAVLTTDNVAATLHDFEQAAVSMFGCHKEAASVGISGRVELHSLDGPVVLLSLYGRFWHRRETVLANAAAFLRRRIPEIADVDVADPDDLVDIVYDDETGQVVSDRRAPDFNGDRETMEYQGVDPDTRGPFAPPAGGFRPGGSMFT